MNAGRKAAGAKRQAASAERGAPCALRLAPCAALLALALAGYWLLLIYHLGVQWSGSPQYNYGWSVPFLCAYLIWHRLQFDVQGSKFKVQSSKFDVRIPKPEVEIPKSPVQGSKFKSPPLSCLFTLALCALLYAPTRLLHEANPVWRLTSLLWTLEVIGITLATVRLAFGPQRLAQVAFPVCFFLVSVPWLYPVEVFVVEQLTRLNVGATIELLGWCGVPAIQHGNVIEIGAGMVGIDEACSGIRSLQATLMISLFLGELYSLTAMRRAVCVLAGFAFAFVFNVGRTFLLTRIAALKGTGAIATWHDPAGVTILLACFVSLWLLALRLRRRRAREERREESGERREKKGTEGTSLHLPAPLSSLLSPLFYLLPWLLLVEAGTEFWYRSHEHATNRRENWSVQLPAGYQPKQVQELVTVEFKYDQATAAEWEDGRGAHWQLYYFRWNPARSLARRVAVQSSKMHGPATCLTHIGMTLKSDLGASLVSVGDFKLAIQHYVFEVEGKPLHVFFGIYEDQTGSAVLANRRLGTASRISAALAGSRNYGQRFLEIAVSGYDRPEDARAALAHELEALIKS